MIRNDFGGFIWSRFHWRHFELFCLPDSISNIYRFFRFVCKVDYTISWMVFPLSFTFFLAANSNYWSANKFFSGFYLKNVYTVVGQKKELAHHLDWVECAHSSIFVCVSTQFCVINEFTIFIWIAHRVRYIIHLLEFVMSFEWLCLSLNHFISDCERFIAFRFFVRIVVNEMPFFFVLNVCLLTETALFCRCVWKSRGAFFDWIIHVPV